MIKNVDAGTCGEENIEGPRHEIQPLTTKEEALRTAAALCRSFCNVSHLLSLNSVRHRVRVLLRTDEEAP